MSLIADGVLIFTCLTTAVYCYVLSARLKRLSKTDEGIGQQIAQLNAALEETRTALKDIRASAKTASDRLTRETGQAKKVAAALAKRVADADAVLSRAYPAAPASAPAEVELSPEPESNPVPHQAAQDASAETESENTEAKAAMLVAEDVVEDDVDIVDIEDDAEEAVLNDALGAHQLGFLPELDDFDEEDDSVVESPAAEDLVVTPIRETAADPDTEGPDEKGVMTVERVAL